VVRGSVIRSKYRLVAYSVSGTKSQYEPKIKSVHPYSAASIPHPSK
jgi:hypothetical protein